MPDIVANSGGVIVSYLEWVQNLENQQWDLETVEQFLEKRMVRAVDAVADRRCELEEKAAGRASLRGKRPTLRDAALVTAISRLAEVVLQRDIWL